MKAVFEKKFKSLDGDVYDTAKEARKADKEFKYELKQKKCKHLKTKIVKESRCISAEYEQYEYATVYVKYCRVCEKDVTDILEVSESEANRYEVRQRYNAEHREFNALRKRFKS